MLRDRGIGLGPLPGSRSLWVVADVSDPDLARGLRAALRQQTDLVANPVLAEGSQNIRMVPDSVIVDGQQSLPALYADPRELAVRARRQQRKAERGIRPE